MSSAFTTTRNGYPGLHLRQKCGQNPKHRLVEAIEPCPVHGDLFEGIVSIGHTLTGAAERIYIPDHRLWCSGRNSQLYSLLNRNMVILTLAFTLSNILFCSSILRHSVRSARRGTSQKGTHSLPVALARPCNLDAAPLSASKFASISIEDQRQSCNTELTSTHHSPSHRPPSQLRTDTSLAQLGSTASSQQHSVDFSQFP